MHFLTWTRVKLASSKKITGLHMCICSCKLRLAGWGGDCSHHIYAPVPASAYAYLRYHQALTQVTFPDSFGCCRAHCSPCAA